MDGGTGGATDVEAWVSKPSHADPRSRSPDRSVQDLRDTGRIPSRDARGMEPPPSKDWWWWYDDPRDMHDAGFLVPERESGSLRRLVRHAQDMRHDVAPDRAGGVGVVGAAENASGGASYEIRDHLLIVVLKEGREINKGPREGDGGGSDRVPETRCASPRGDLDGHETGVHDGEFDRRAVEGEGGWEEAGGSREEVLYWRCSPREPDEDVLRAVSSYIDQCWKSSKGVV